MPGSKQAPHHLSEGLSPFDPRVGRHPDYVRGALVCISVLTVPNYWRERRGSLLPDLRI